MTDIEKKALALVNEIEREEGEKELTTRIMRGLIMDLALCRAIEQHEAFKQKVSHAIEDVTNRDLPVAVLRRFVIEDDPLADALTEAFNDGGAWAPCNKADADNLRAALKARGLEIREKGQ